MNIKSLKYELQNILSGKSAVSHGATLQAITRYLRGSVGASAETQRTESIKSQETRQLIEYINAQQLWNCDIPFGLFIASGAEQRVFIKGTQQVLKLNDAIYYVKAFLQTNGFINTRNHDYFHPELGIILEDLHDENVLTAHEMLYFIDTVFYIKPKIFWESVSN